MGERACRQRVVVGGVVTGFGKVVCQAEVVAGAAMAVGLVIAPAGVGPGNCASRHQKANLCRGEVERKVCHKGLGRE
jgi:hypothetical protein